METLAVMPRETLTQRGLSTPPADAASDEVTPPTTSGASLLGASSWETSCSIFADANAMGCNWLCDILEGNGQLGPKKSETSGSLGHVFERNVFGRPRVLSSHAGFVPESVFVGHITSGSVFGRLALSCDVFSSRRRL